MEADTFLLDMRNFDLTSREEVNNLPTGLTRYGSFSVNERMGWVYLIATPDGYKIGKTFSLRNRMRQHHGFYNGEISILAYHFFERDTLKRESQFHNVFKEKRMGKSEMFDLKEEDIELFKNFNFLQFLILGEEDEFVEAYRQALPSFRESNKQEVAELIESSTKTHKEIASILNITISALSKMKNRGVSNYRLAQLQRLV